MKLYLLTSVLGVLFLPTSCWVLSIVHYMIDHKSGNFYIAMEYTSQYIANSSGIFVSWILFGNLTYLIIKTFTSIMEA